MRWGTYFSVVAAVVAVGLALGVTLPLVSLRLVSWGYGQFAVGVMASMPALGILLGARLTGFLASRLGTPKTLRLCLLVSAASVALVALLPSYPLWLLLRLVIGMSLTVVFVLGESWINQLVEDHLRGRLVALYGSGFALSQLCGPLLLTALGTEGDQGFWVSTTLLLVGCIFLIGRSGAPVVDAHSAAGRGLGTFCRKLPAIAWAVALFAAFESMVLTLMPVYLINEGFAQKMALLMVSTVVVGDAALQLPIGWLADRVPRQLLMRGCGVMLLVSSLSIPLTLHTPLIWLALICFGASVGGLYTLSLILVGQRYRDDALVRANAHIALLWGVGCLIGPLSTGAASQWLSGHALPLLMAMGAAVFILLARRRDAFTEIDGEMEDAAAAR